MKQFFNFGVSDPLTLGMGHPLAHRLETMSSPKASRRVTRSVTVGLLLGAATLSAPLIQADAHPDEELAGNYTTHQGKSVIKRKMKRDGKTTSEHFEINVDGDDVKAYKIDPFGKRTRIDVADIEGVDIADVLEEKIEGDMAAWVPKNHKGKFVLKTKDGSTRFEFKDVPKPPHAPVPPGFSKHADNEIIIRSDTFEGLEGLVGLEALEGLKGLEGLEKLKTLRRLKGLKSLKNLESLKDLEKLEGLETFTIFADDEGGFKLKMQLTESKLAAARAMLEDTEIDADDSREMAKAKRELEKARKALKAAERALKDAK